MIPALIAASATLGACSLELGPEIHETRCRIVNDGATIVLTPASGSEIAPGTATIVLRRDGTRRALIGGVEGFGEEEAFEERSGGCWTGLSMRVCAGRPAKPSPSVTARVPITFHGRWAVRRDERCDGDLTDLVADATTLTDVDGIWKVGAVIERDGVIAVSGRSDSSGRPEERTWLMTVGPRGRTLLLKAPAADLERCPDRVIDLVGTWAAYSTEAYRTLGGATVAPDRISFDKGLVLGLGFGGAARVIADPKGVARRLCGDESPPFVTIIRSATPWEAGNMRVTFHRSRPEPDPDFQPSTCVGYTYVPTGR